MKKSNPKALLPIGVFLVLYLGLGIVFEYVMKIPMGFYNIPIVLAFMVAILTACLQNRKVSFDDKLGIMAQGIADKNIITMLLILSCGGKLCGRCRTQQCGKRSVFYAVTDSGQICSGGTFCGGMLCVNCHGNIGRNDHTDRADCGGGIGCIRF